MSKRASKSDSPSSRNCKRSRETAIHKWTKQEVDSILEYMLTKIKDGCKPMEPTAKLYCGKMVDILNLDNVTHVKLKNKIDNLKNSYLKMVEWRNCTGQGILADEGEASVRAYILKQCPEFDTLDEIYGSNVSLNPPYIHESGDDAIVFDDLEVAEVMGDASLTIVEDEAEKQAESPENTKKSERCILKANTRTRVLKKDALSELIGLQNQRSEGDAKKYDLEVKKFEHAKEWKAKEYELEVMKLDTQKELRIKEMEKEERIAIAKLKMEKEERMEKFKLELDFRKC